MSRKAIHHFYLMRGPHKWMFYDPEAQREMNELVTELGEKYASAEEVAELKSVLALTELKLRLTTAKLARYYWDRFSDDELDVVFAYNVVGLTADGSVPVLEDVMARPRYWKVQLMIDHDVMSINPIEPGFPHVTFRRDEERCSWDPRDLQDEPAQPRVGELPARQRPHPSPFDASNLAQ